MRSDSKCVNCFDAWKFGQNHVIILISSPKTHYCESAPISKKVHKRECGTGDGRPWYAREWSLLGNHACQKEFWLRFDSFQAVERRGVGAMELVAMDMKLRGSYIARQLSFYGVSFKIEEVTLDPGFVDIYNSSVKLVMLTVLFISLFL